MSQSETNGSAKPIFSAAFPIFETVQASAKEASHRGALMFARAGELTRGNLEAFGAAGKIASDGVRDLSRETSEYAAASIERASTAFATLSAAKTPVELMAAQRKLAEETARASLNRASDLSAAYVKLLGEIFEPLTARFGAAVAKAD